MKLYLPYFVLFSFWLTQVQAQVIIDALGNQHILRIDNTVDVTLKDKSIYLGKGTPPTFFGGDGKLNQYIVEHLVFNESSNKYKTWVRCLINDEGMVEIPFILKSSGNKIFDDLALKLVEGMPDWKAAEANGVNVKTFVNIEISNAFVIPKSTDNNMAPKSRINEIGYGEIYDNDTIDESKPGNSATMFKSGQAELFRWLAMNIKYPATARENNIQGKVVVGFVVEADGHITTVELLKSSGNELLDNEAIRVIESMPDWTPAKLNGKNVRSSFKLPVGFKLEG